MNRRKLIFFGAAASILVLLIFLFSGKGSGHGDTVKAHRGEAVQAVYATGVVEPTFWAALAPEKTGRLLQVLRDEGAEVLKGEPVAQLDSSVEEAHIDEMKARLDFLQKDLDRKRELMRSHATSTRQLQDAESDYNEMKARIEAMQGEADRMKLLSPVAGVILRRDVEPGETVEAGKPVMWVGRMRPLRITAEVDEEDIGLVKVGQEALIKADAFPGQVFDGKVNEVTPKGDPVNKVFRARISLPDDTPLLIGMTTEVNIITRRVPDALLIPIASESGGKVWRVESGRAKPVDVKIGIRGESEEEVNEGLKEGDEILSAPPTQPPAG
jgi:HlyD family secretion protein